jgi:putative flippase GtrA
MWTSHLKEKFVFLVVGGFCASFYIGLAEVVHSSGLTPTAASVLAYVVCIPLGYLGHRAFTFQSTRSHRHAGLAYPAVQVIALTIAAAVTFVSTHIFRLPATATFFLAALAAASASYFLQKNWVF